MEYLTVVKKIRIIQGGSEYVLLNLDENLDGPQLTQLLNDLPKVFPLGIHFVPRYIRDQKAFNNLQTVVDSLNKGYITNFFMDEMIIDGAVLNSTLLHFTSLSRFHLSNCSFVNFHSPIFESFESNICIGDVSLINCSFNAQNSVFLSRGDCLQIINTQLNNCTFYDTSFVYTYSTIVNADDLLVTNCECNTEFFCCCQSLSHFKKVQILRSDIYVFSDSAGDQVLTDYIFEAVDVQDSSVILARSDFLMKYTFISPKIKTSHFQLFEGYASDFLLSGLEADGLYSTSPLISIGICASISIDSCFLSNCTIPTFLKVDYCRDVEIATFDIDRVKAAGRFFSFGLIGKLAIEKINVRYADFLTFAHVNKSRKVKLLQSSFDHTGTTEPLLHGVEIGQFQFFDNRFVYCVLPMFYECMESNVNVTNLQVSQTDVNVFIAGKSVFLPEDSENYMIVNGTALIDVQNLQLETQEMDALLSLVPFMLIFALGIFFMLKRTCQTKLH